MRVLGGFLLGIAVAAILGATATPMAEQGPSEWQKVRALVDLGIRWNNDTEAAGIPMNKGELQEVLDISELVWNRYGGIHPEGTNEFDQVYSALSRGFLLWLNLNRAGHTKDEIERVKKAYRWLPNIQAFMAENGV